jgi:hypothetical protein
MSNVPLDCRAKPYLELMTGIVFFSISFVLK